MLFRTLTMVILAATSVGPVGCNHSPAEIDKTASLAALPVRVTRVVRRTEFSYPMNFYGRVKASQESALAFELDGLVATLAVDEGDQVRQGQPLATLNTEILAAERKVLVARKGVEETLLKRLHKGERPEVILAARAVVQRLKAEVLRAWLNQRREQKLLPTGSVSDTQYEKSKYEYESLKFSLEERKAILNRLENGARQEDIDAQTQRVETQDAEIGSLDVRIKKSTLFAPFDGQVIVRSIDEGTVVESGQPILVVSDMTRREARFSLPLAHLTQATNVESVKVRDQEVAVRDLRIVSKVDPVTRTVDVVFELESTTRLIAGETCVVTVQQTDETNCVELPVGALVPSVRGLWSCYRIDENSSGDGFLIVKEAVTILHTDGDHVFVRSAVSDNALIVADGVQKLVPGMRVRPVEDLP